METVWVRVKLDERRSIIVSCIYRSPSTAHSGPDAAQNRQLAPKPNSTCDAAVVLFLLKID